METTPTTPPPPAAETKPCPKCQAPIQPAESFCAACGFKLKESAVPARRAPGRIGMKYAKQTYQKNIQSGRTAILVIAILLVLGTVLMYFLQNSEVSKAEDQIRQVRGNPLYDQAQIQEAEKNIEKAKGLVMLFLIGNIVLTVTYFGLWIWAKHKPLPAAMTALILFLTLQAINLAIEPMTIFQGIIMKIIILAVLIRAVTSAQKYQKLKQQGM